ncbi:hypothetical protein GOM49_04485 [Clostridium bovifaecis]|uniref:Uncharacterized protein n=1 Tax=Clostridium bovifaecis TaxID=2184719 RepID=A0A6I6F131_9CLOT|nr:hypothetical protein GOM49_04485 [Clostridium bovifaecis]
MAEQINLFAQQFHKNCKRKNYIYYQAILELLLGNKKGLNIEEICYKMINRFDKVSRKTIRKYIQELYDGHQINLTEGKGNEKRYIITKYGEDTVSKHYTLK